MGHLPERSAAEEWWQWRSLRGKVVGGVLFVSEALGKGVVLDLQLGELKREMNHSHLVIIVKQLQALTPEQSW